MPNSATVQLILAVASISSLASCRPEPQKIEQPEKWQAHLQEAKLPADYAPIITERVYVPIYSHIYHEDSEKKLPLVSTLSIRNTDMKQSLILKNVSYYDSQGKLLETVVAKPVVLAPLATADVVVARLHEAGGSGANFIVDWMADHKVTAPLIEAVMVSTGSGQNVSFVSRGAVIEHTDATSTDSTTRPTPTAKPKSTEASSKPSKKVPLDPMHE